MNEILAQTIKRLFTPTKGILASDESVNSANKNLAKVGVEGSEEIRRKYRELFISTPEFENYVSGMILFDETFWQNDSNGTRFVEILQEKDIIPIIKVDAGLVDFPDHPGEKFTQGLDGLDARLANYFKNGARAAKWRALFNIDDDLPSEEVLDANATQLTLYSMLCHKNSIVPIIEPEVLLKGTHSFKKSKTATSLVLQRVFEKHEEYKVDLANVILKSSMVLPGKDSGEDATPAEIGEATVAVFKESVPSEVPGIVFLSGGQEPMEATTNLNAIAKNNDTAWRMTFSFLRAIEGPAAEVWQGKDENVEKAREVFLEKLKLDSLASQGLL